MPTKLMSRKFNKGKRSDKLTAMQIEKRAAIEEEQKRKREELLSIFLKIKHSKEDTMTKSNTHKLNNNWRNIMRNAKSKQLQKEIQILRKVFERQLDCKDEMIRNLLRTASESNEQRMEAVRTHISGIEKILQKHFVNLSDIREKQYYSRLQVLGQEHEAVNAQLEKRHTDNMRYLDAVLSRVKDEAFEGEKERKAYLSTRTDEIKNKHIEEQQGLKFVIDGIVEEQWNEFQKILRAYHDETDTRYKQFVDLTEKEQGSLTLIAENNQKICAFQDSIASLRVNLADSEARLSRHQACLRSDLDGLKQLQREAKRMTAREMQLEKEVVTQLSVHSDHVIKKFTKYKTETEHIIKLYECCTKQENDCEKVLPYMEKHSDVQQAVEDEKIEKISELQEDVTLLNIVQDYDVLKSFWRRVNRVTLDKTSLELLLHQLTQERNSLRQILIHYMSTLNTVGVRDMSDPTLPPPTNSIVSGLQSTEPCLQINAKELQNEDHNRTIRAHVLESAHSAKHLLDMKN